MNIVNLVDWLTARLVLNWADESKSVKTRWQKHYYFSLLIPVAKYGYIPWEKLLAILCKKASIILSSYRLTWLHTFLIIAVFQLYKFYLQIFEYTNKSETVLERPFG